MTFAHRSDVPFPIAIAMAIAVGVAVVASVAPRPAAAATAIPPPHTRRIAILVGANEPAPGRLPLRYAHADARRLGEVLQRLGHFAAADVHTLFDPAPPDLLAAVDRAAADARNAGGDALLVFYYSGHSDGQSLFPHGQAVALADLRDRLAQSGARIKVGILDTCRGGSWTRAKGLAVGPALEPADLMNVTTEGTALLSSSSGMESAHEAEAMHGSFFTHHLAAGLLGAADKSGDGSVTLQEAFDYAKERTVRDSARLAATPQHPSFDVHLRGRQDVILTQLAAAPSALVVSQSQPIEVVHVPSGVTVVETPPGRQELRLALPPGRYVVRRVADDRVYSREVEVPAGGAVALADTQLELTGQSALAMKGAETPAPAPPEPSPLSHSTLPRNHWELRVAAGVSTGPSHTFGGIYATGAQRTADRPLQRDPAFAGSFTYGITDRLTWAVPLPALAYRFGNEGSFELIPRGGLTGLGFSSVVGVVAVADAGVGARAWVARPLSLVADTTVGYSFAARTADDQSVQPERVALRASLGAAWAVGDRVTLHFGGGWAGEASPKGAPVASPSGAVVLGAVQTLGFRPLPLVQVRVARALSLDGYASWSIDLRDGSVRDRYLAGFTWGF